jgi:hypothetical protein
MNCPRCSAFLEPGVLYCNECDSKLKKDKHGELHVRNEMFTRNLSLLRCPNCHKVFKSAKSNISKRGLFRLKFLCPHCSASLVSNWKPIAYECSGWGLYIVCVNYSTRAHSWSTAISILFYLLWLSAFVLVFYGLGKRSLLVEKESANCKGA